MRPSSGLEHLARPYDKEQEMRLTMMMKSTVAAAVLSVAAMSAHPVSAQAEPGPDFDESSVTATADQPESSEGQADSEDAPDAEIADATQVDAEAGRPMGWPPLGPLPQRSVSVVNEALEVDAASYVTEVADGRLRGDGDEEDDDEDDEEEEEDTNAAGGGGGGGLPATGNDAQSIALFGALAIAAGGLLSRTARRELGGSATTTR